MRPHRANTPSEVKLSVPTCFLSFPWLPTHLFSPSSNPKLQGPPTGPCLAWKGPIVYSVCGPQASLTACCSSSNRVISAVILARRFIRALEVGLTSAAATVLTGCVRWSKDGFRCSSDENSGMSWVMLSTKRTCARKLKTVDTFEPRTFQVDAARRGGRLQAGQPLLKRPRSHLLLILCVLHQVCCWHFLGSFHALSGVSAMTNLLVNCTSLWHDLGFAGQKWSLHICAAAASEGGWFSVTCKCVCV